MENWKLGHNYLREERSKGNVLGPFEAHCHMGGASKVALVVKNSPANAGHIRDTGLIRGFRRSSGEGNGNLLQYSCLKNSMDRGAWWDIQSMGLQRVGHD